MGKSTIILLFLSASITNSLGHEGCKLQGISNDVTYITCERNLDNLQDVCSDFLKTDSYMVDLVMTEVNLDHWPDYKIDEEVVHLTQYQVEVFHNKISNFKELTELTISHGNVSGINFKTILDLKHLKKFNASHNIIDSLAILEHIYSDSSDVITVDLSYNRITTISNSFFELFSRVKYLYLSHNLIENINSLGFIGTSELELLDLSHNRLKEIVPSFAKFVNVKYLFLNNNNLTSINKSYFEKMYEIQELNLSFNNLKEIEDESLVRLRKIKKLDLSNNKLTKITAKMLPYNNKIMQSLYLADNPIQTNISKALQGMNITHLYI